MSDGNQTGVLLSLDTASTTPATSTTPPNSADAQGKPDVAAAAATPGAAQTPAAGAEAAPAGTESKPAGGDAPSGEGAETVEDNSEDSPAESEGAPETYQFEAPEGFELDPKAGDSFEPIARELNLSNEKANKLIGVLASEITRVKEREIADFNAEVGRWVETAKNDPEIGGKESDKRLGIAKAALNKFGSEGFGKLLTDFKMGNHPEVIRFAYRVGLTLQEDKSVHRGAPPAAKPKSDAEVFFPELTPQGS